MTVERIPVTERESVAAVVHEGGPEWLVFCHGLVSDKEGSYEGRCERAVEEGYSAVRFDVRGCGESDGGFGQSSLSSRLADLAAVVDHLDPDSYVVVGSSFGGAVALLAAAVDDRVTAVATRAPVTSTERLAALQGPDGTASLGDGYTLEPAFFADLATHDMQATLSSIAVPVAIVHGDEDASVPVTDSVAALESLTGEVYFERVAGEGHRFSRAGERRFRNRLFQWLDTIEPEP